MWRPTRHSINIVLCKVFRLTQSRSLPPLGLIAVILHSCAKLISDKFFIQTEVMDGLNEFAQECRCFFMDNRLSIVMRLIVIGIV